MRVALVFLSASDSESLSNIATLMARSLEALGHRVEIAGDRDLETRMLTGYDYVIIGTEPDGLGSRIPKRVSTYLAQAGMLSGKRSMAFVRRAGLAPERALARLMKAMEAEGMMVNCGEVVDSKTASDIARNAPVERAAFQVRS